MFKRRALYLSDLFFLSGLAAKVLVAGKNQIGHRRWTLFLSRGGMTIEMGIRTVENRRVFSA